MKAYTTIEQSKKLAEILPLETADMFWLVASNTPRIHVLTEPLSNYSYWENYPAWSLAALLEVIRNNGRYELQMYEGGYYFEANGFMAESYFNPVDACVEMIVKLHKLNLL